MSELEDILQSIQKSFEGQVAVSASLAEVLGSQNDTLSALSKNIGRNNELLESVVSKQEEEEEDKERDEKEEELVQRLKSRLEKDWNLTKDVEQDEPKPAKLETDPEKQQEVIEQKSVKKADEEEEEEEEEEEFPKVEKKVQKSDLKKLVDEAVAKRLGKMGYTTASTPTVRRIGNENIPIVKSKKPITREEAVEELKNLSYRELNNLRFDVEAGKTELPEMV